MTEDENDKEEIKLLMTILREKGFHEAVRRWDGSYDFDITVDI